MNEKGSNTELLERKGILAVSGNKTVCGNKVEYSSPTFRKSQGTFGHCKGGDFMAKKPPLSSSTHAKLLFLCEKSPYYSGIERELPFYKKNFSIKMIKKILKLADSSGNIVYSNYNFKILSGIKDKLLYNGIETDLLYVTDSNEKTNNIKEEFLFVGYDVSGDSYYHSLVFKILHEKSKGVNFKNVQENFSKKLNDNGLFTNKSDALEFIDVIKSFYDINEIESDDNIRPIQVYLKK